MSINTVLILSLINGTSMRAARVMLVLYALALDAQPLTIGILAACFSLSPVLFAVPAGRLADRFGVRWLLILGAVAGSCGMLGAYFLPGLPAIFVAAMLIGLLDVFDVVSLQNLVGLLSTSENRARNFSKYSLTRSTASLIGPLIAGFSIDLAGHAAAASYLALWTMLPVFILLPGPGSPARADGHRSVSTGGGVWSMLSDSDLRKVLATSCLLNTGREMFQLYLPVYAYAMGLSASTIGIVVALNAVAEFAVQVVLPQLVRWSNEQKVLAYAFFVGAVSFALIPYFKDAVTLACVSFMFGLGSGCGAPIITMLMFGNAPPGRSAEALGLRMTVNHMTRLAGPLAFGSIGSAFGVSQIFWINAVMMGTGGVLSRPKKARE